MLDTEYISFKCLQVEQPIGVFYLGVMEATDVLSIAYADIRRIEAREIELFVGIQRPLSDTRVRELRDYVRTIDASFPTSVILAVASEQAEFDATNGMMRIKRDEKVAKIIDGQHRIAGLTAATGRFQLNVTIFVDMDLEEQAMVFSTINLRQTKVSKSLAYDLFEFASSRSPQKTCHNVATLLNSKDGSPFKDRIKILGRATGKPAETLTQATFVDRLIKYVSNDPMSDRDVIKRGDKPLPPSPAEENSLIFRRLFVSERDAEIAKNVWNYFTAVARRWPDAWPNKEPGNILNRTTGFGALMRFLRSVYVNYGNPDTVIPLEVCEQVFKKVTLNDSDFTPEHFKPGGSGEKDLYNELMKQAEMGSPRSRNIAETSPPLEFSE